VLRPFCPAGPSAKASGFYLPNKAIPELPAISVVELTVRFNTIGPAEGEGNVTPLYTKVAPALTYI
jgi:hypothetical protein